MNPPSRTARRALHLLTRYLPMEVRDDYEQEWLTDLVQAPNVPLKLVELALSIPDLAIEEHTRTLHLEPIAPRRADRALFALGKTLTWAFVAFTLLADLIYAYMQVKQGRDSSWLTIVVFNACLLGYWQVVNCGAYRDCPWLRTTRLASFIKLLWFGVPLLLAATHTLPDSWGRVWALSFIVYLPWETYWNVRRPYRQHGVLPRAANKRS